MSIEIKYRIFELGKDFGVQSKEIMELLAKYSTLPKNHMAVLSEKELDIVFDYYTKKHQLESLLEYFSAFPVVEKHQPTEQEKLSDTEANSKKTADKNIKGEKQTPIDNKPISGKVEDRVRHVDTRTANVDLSKFDDKVDKLIPDKAKDIGNQKQKFKKPVNRQYKSSSKYRNEEANKLKRLEIEKKKKASLKLVLPEEIAVSELASKLIVTNAEIVKKLLQLGIMASASQIIDYDTASLIAEEFGAKVSKQVIVTIEDRLIDISEDKDEELSSRSPVVVVMGHVDHGKTSLLDAIRNANVIATESGGITQHIGAYRVKINKKEITFLDTPGHAAFTAMRARGALVTDIAILVVAADDGIMPQTIEAINHAKAAGVSIIVAINKMDKEGANPEKIKQELTEYGLVTEEWGGDTICVPVSAIKKENIDKLLEMIILVSEMKELKSNPNRLAKGTVIEAKLDKGRGPIATVLVQNGTLKIGDIIIAGTTVGRVRIMIDDKGNKVTSAGASIPVEIVGLGEVPDAGEVFHCVNDERMAREVVEQRKYQAKQELYGTATKVSLEDLFELIKDGEIKDLNIIVKADVQGSVEAIKASLEKIANEEVRVKVIHGGVGAINESDISLATVSNAIVVGFNVRPDAGAFESATQSNVDVRYYSVIYDCIDEIQTAMKGMLTPKFKEVFLGKVEIRNVFKITGSGTIAGCYVTNGKITRSASIRLVRDGIVVHTGKTESLKRFKDDVKEVAEGYECGIGIEKYNDLKVGDIIEAFIMEEIKQ